MIKNSKILVVAAHPDDEVLGCGATMAKHSKENEIYVLILGEGITSRYDNPADAFKDDLAKLKEKAEKSAKLLGAKQVFFFDLSDNRFDTVPFLDIVKKVEKLIYDIKPDIVFTHHSGDLNIDHRITFQAVMTAARPQNNNSVKEIYSFEILSSTEWSCQKIERPFLPNVFEDASEHIEKKLEALKIYESEMKEFPHPRSEEGVKILAQKRGMEVGLKYAEAFELIRKING